MSKDATTLIGRRQVAKGAAWAVPTITMGAMAPAMAASIRIDPGINGWVLNSPRRRWWNCGWSLDVNSNPSPTPPTPDGAPFGLYLYDVDPTAVITDAKLTYWIIGDQNASFSAASGHGSCWQGPVRGTPATKADGLVYTPYTWNYNCTIDPSTVSADGRLYLQNFHVEATFTQPSNRCNDLTYWTQRSITIDAYGDGNPEVLTFERRNGTRGPYNGNSRRAPQAMSQSGEDPTPAAS